VNGGGSLASMGPPREHGGMITLDADEDNIVVELLQWGRRVNTAE
jgi:hypothetical protein